MQCFNMFEKCESFTHVFYLPGRIPVQGYLL